MLATPDSSGLENVAYRGYGKQRHSGVLLRRIDVEILNLPKLRPFLPAETSYDGDALIALFQQANRCTAYGGGSRIRHIGVRYTYDIRAVRIDLDLGDCRATSHLA